MSVLRRGPIRARRFDLPWSLFLGLITLLGAALLWGQSLKKEYINLNGRTLAIETPIPTFTMVGVAPGGSYPIHTTQQTVSFQINSLGGIDHFNFYLDNIWDARDACFVAYFPAYNELGFDDSAGNETVYQFGTGASPSSISNNHCTLDLVHTSITATPTSAAVSLPITLRPSSVGAQNVYVTVVDNNYNYFYGGIPRASWTAFDEITTAPPTYSLLNTLNSGNSQTLYFKFSDGNGYRYIDQYAHVMLAYDAAANNAPCYFFFHPNDLLMSQDSYQNGVFTELFDLGTIGGGWSAPYTGHPCSVDLVNSKFHVNPDPTQPDPDPNLSLVTDFYLDLVVSLDATLTHPLGVYSGDIDRAGRGMWAPGGTAFQVGTWP